MKRNEQQVIIVIKENDSHYDMPRMDFLYRHLERRIHVLL